MCMHKAIATARTIVDATIKYNLENTGPCIGASGASMVHLLPNKKSLPADRNLDKISRSNVHLQS